MGKLAGDSIYDKTRHWEMKNTFALATLEGFSKWAKAGIKAFASYDMRHFDLPTMEGGIENITNIHLVLVVNSVKTRKAITL